MHSYETYTNPLVERYASPEMIAIFSAKNKYTIWHQLWYQLAKIQKELGVLITDEQLAEMEENIGKIDFEKAALYEKKTRHEVMAHIYAWGEICPKARPIIHLGATSAFVMDNGDLIQMAQALRLIQKRLLTLIKKISDFADQYKDLPTLGYTHFQPAQLTTVGKRACLWLYDFYLDFLDLEYRLENFQLRGVKGTVGTQDSFMKIFNNDEEKIKQLDQKLSIEMGFPKGSVPVSGQTYTRKIDYLVLSVMSSLAQSAHKVANDIRLLQGLGEIEEPFEENQVGSSAMPYKRNPMRCERVCSLSRFVMQLSELAGQNHAVQWLERTLDDSANRRIMISEVFLAVDAILLILTNVFQGIKVYPQIIQQRIQENLPFLTAETVIMESVKRGQDRQTIHEIFRNSAMTCIQDKKEKGISSNLIENLLNHPEIGLTKKELLEILDPQTMTGRSRSQVIDFIEKNIQPLLKKYEFLITKEKIELKV